MLLSSIEVILNYVLIFYFYFVILPLDRLDVFYEYVCMLVCLSACFHVSYLILHISETTQPNVISF